MSKKHAPLNFTQFFISGVITISAALPVWALLEGDPELLRITAKAQTENRNRIKSWQGQAQVETTREDANGVMHLERSLYDFVFSRRHDATKWKWTGQKRYIREDLLTGEDPPSENWGYNIKTEMRKGNAFYVCPPGFMDENALVIWPREKSHEGAYSYSFDPMWYLTGSMTAGSDDITEMLLNFHRRPKFAPNIILKVSRKENLVVFETNYKDENMYVVNRHTFDLSKGGSVMEYYAESNSGTELRQWTYEQQDGVWIPRTFVFSHKRNVPGFLGLIKRTRKVNFINNNLNQSIPSSEFSLKSLGLKNGGRITHRKTKHSLIYHEENEEQLLQELGLSTKYEQDKALIPEFMEPLTNKPLPEIKSLGVNLSPDYIEKKVLVCFFDMEQRPSRNCMMQLSKRAQELKAKDIVIVAVQASKIEKEKLDEWIKENNIPFFVGMIEGDEEKTQFAWGVKSLPWLILTNPEHIVRAEGFSISELDTYINEKPSSSRTIPDSNQVTGIVRNPQGQVLADVKVTEYQTDKQYSTNKQGKFTSAYGPSDERRVFFAVDKQNKMAGVGRLAAGEQHLDINLVPAHIVSGTVVDPDGKPVAGAQVAPLPMTCYHVLTDEQGKFDVGWAPQWSGDLKAFFLMSRHLDRNLAGGIEISTETENIQIELEPALRLTGTVEDPNNEPIAGAKVGISLIRHRWGAGTPVREVITDESGRFEIPTLLQKQEYGIGANADGYWRNAIKTGTINKITDREDIGAIILKRPILSVSGIVVDGGGKPVANIPVYLHGSGQPDLDSKTDEQGKFIFEKVCSGHVQISAKNQDLYGEVDTKGGAENVKIIVSPRFEPKTNTP